jgi:O-antigen/teichoic acid export membrane protein
MGPDEYGLLSSVFTFVAILGVSASSLQAACAKGEAVRSSAADSAPRSLHTRTLRNDPLTRIVLVTSFALALTVVAASPLLGRFFHSSVGPALALGTIIPSLGLLAVAYGRLQGLQRFIPLAILSLALAFGKLVLGAVGLSLGLGVTGVLVLLAILSSSGAIVGLWLTADVAPLQPGDLTGDVARALLAFTAFWVLLSVDVPFARHWLEHADAGQYAAGSVVGKGILWLPDVIALVIFPQLAASVRAATGSRRLLARAVSVSVTLCLAGCLGLLLVGDRFMSELYGDDYSRAATVAWKLGFASIPFAIANLLMFYHLARGGWKWVISLVAVLVGELAAFTWVHGGATSFIVVTGLAGLVLTIALAVPILAENTGSASAGAGRE